MKHFAFLPLSILFLSAGAVQSQAPISASGVASSLQALVTTNKALIEKQQKTLDALDQLAATAQQMKMFGRGG